MSENKEMSPMSGDEVEVDGVYENEAGRTAVLSRGDTFPSDLYLGKTEWDLLEIKNDDLHPVKQDPLTSPRRVIRSGNNSFIPRSKS